MANAKRLVSLGGMLGILVLACWFDRLFEFALLGIPSGRVPPVIWVSAVTNWVLAGLVLLLAWFVIFKNGGNPLVFLCFSVVGLLVTFSLSLYSLGASDSLPPLLGQALAVFLPVSPRSLAFHASAFIAIIGVIGLLIWTADHRPRTAHR